MAVTPHLPAQQVADGQVPTSDEPAARLALALTLTAMCLGAMTIFLLVTASATALSAIQDDLHVSPTGLVWIPSSYTLLVASLVLGAGTLGNRFGRKRMFVLGAAVLMAGSLTSFFAHATGAVIVGQLVGGIGGAFILPNSLAILGASFPDPHRRTEVVTAWAAASGVGLALGPVVAGVLLNHFSWHAVFLSSTALGAVTIALSLRAVPESRQAGVRLDVPGQILAVAGIGSLVYALIQGGRDGYTSGRIVAAWVVAAVALIAFVLVERRAPAPMLDMALFRSRSFSAVMFIAAVSLFGFTGVSILAVLYYERVQRLSALNTAWRLLPMFAVYVVVAYATGRIVRRTGFKLPLTAGLVLGAAAVFGLVSQDATTPYSQVWWLYGLFGAGCGLSAAPSTAAALVSVTRGQAGMAAGAVNAFRQVGSVMGVSLLGTLLTRRLNSRLPDALAAHHVPLAVRPAVEAAVATGKAPEGAPGTVISAVGDAFVSGVHAGLILTGVVFLVGALAALLAVHSRPHAVAATPG